MTGSRSSRTSSSSITHASTASPPVRCPRRRRRGAGRPAADPCPAAIQPADRLRADPPTAKVHTLSSRSDLFRSALAERVARRRRRDGHDAPGRRPLDGRLPGPRGLQRDPQRHPPRHRAQRPRRLLRGGRRLRRDQHLRRQLRQPRRVRHLATASTSWPRPARGSPASRPTPGRPPSSRGSCIGSVGPGTKLPSLGHAPFALLRDAYAEQARGMIDGGVDAILIETSQDLLQAKAAVIGARARAGRRRRGRCRSWCR